MGCDPISSTMNTLFRDAAPGKLKDSTMEGMRYGQEETHKNAIGGWHGEKNSLPRITTELRSGIDPVPRHKVGSDPFTLRGECFQAECTKHAIDVRPHSLAGLPRKAHQSFSESDDNQRNTERLRSVLAITPGAAMGSFI